MNVSTFLVHDNDVFSKILLSKEVADITKQIVKESVHAIHQKPNDGRPNKNKYDV